MMRDSPSGGRGTTEDGCRMPVMTKWLIGVVEDFMGCCQGLSKGGTTRDAGLVEPGKYSTS
jgi:hypothetical protein